MKKYNYISSGIVGILALSIYINGFRGFYWHFYSILWHFASEGIGENAIEGHDNVKTNALYSLPDKKSAKMPIIPSIVCM